MRMLSYATANKPPVACWNRYDRIIGVAFRMGRRRCLSIVWRRP